MTFKVLSREGNTVKLHCDITHKRDTKMIADEFSKVYRCGGANFLIWVEIYQCYSHVDNDTKVYMSAYFGLFDIFEGDFSNLTFVHTISSDVLKKPLERRSSDDLCKCIFRNHQAQYINETKIFKYEFDLNITIDLANTKAPFAQLYEDTRLIDFHMQDELGGKVPVHKTVLTACSPVLKQMLSGEWKETNEGHVTVANATEETLKHFKDYIYMQKLPESDNDDAGSMEYIKQLLLIGSYYMMPDLVQKCMVKILNQLNKDNAIEYITFAVKFQVKHLLMIILNDIKNEVLDIHPMTSTKNWSEMCDGINTTLNQ